MSKNPHRAVVGLLGLAGLAGCQRAVIDGADQQVYTVIQRRQIEALGETHSAQLGEESGEAGRVADGYAFVPHPTDSKLPPGFEPRPPAPKPPEQAPAASVIPGTPTPEETPEQQTEDPTSATAAAETVDGGEAATGASQGEPEHREEAPPAGTTPQPQPPESPGDPPQADSTQPPPPETTPGYKPFEPKEPMRLAETLQYATRHSRQLQTAKEDLYLAGLDLTLERHLWTPQLSTSLSAEFADYGQIRDFDRAMTTVAEVAVRQRLPLGGEVTARMLSTLMRDLGAHVTSGETGQFIMDANIPLFRGAGSVAYESRYVAERELIYAVRTFERFRRQFVVQIASEYFDLQQSQAAIINAEAARDALAMSRQRARSFQKHDRMAIFEVTRVESSFRAAESNVEDALEAYETAKDRFKILIGMPVSQAFDVVPQGEDPLSEEIERLVPQADEPEAVEVAVHRRLDLLTELDRIDDARRGVNIARNGLLPDLNLTGSMAIDTDPARKNSMSYNSERTTWRGMIELTLDDRKTERNAYRESLINLRRGERNYDEARENVRADVRRALRRISQAVANREIQEISVAANVERYAGAEELNKKGRATNQDLVDAQNELLDARNRLAAAYAQYRAAVLELRLATDTLQVDDDGRLVLEVAPPAVGAGS